MQRLLHPRLVGIGGPLEGSVFVLEDDEVSIGRGRSNCLPIDDRSVSRTHCCIRRLSTDQFEIRDLGSRNGTAINGLPTTEHVLENGDEIRLGECRFLFLLTGSPGDSNSMPFRFEEASLDTQTFHQLQTAEKRQHLDLLFGRTALLLKIANGIQMAHTTEDIGRQLLECAFQSIPVERGAVLLFEGSREEPIVACACDREGRPVTLRAHVEIVGRARRDGTAILAPVPSPGGLTHVLAAPIESDGKVTGVIFLEADRPSAALGDEHLQLGEAIGSIFGMPFENARRLEWLEAENRRLQEAIGIEHDMIGTDPRMREVFQFVRKVAPADSSVLIRGESGTGKELVARAIHRNSPRAGQRFFAVNCAALAENLLESELFGYERGAFTGAVTQKKGKLEAADGGTLFLDEVGELPLAFQTKLLRVLQEREFERVGGTYPIRVDVRLIAATNRDLETAISGNAFRKDLYYRLNVVSLIMPPLRERREDIPLLARYFVAKHGKKARRNIAGLSPEALACLEAYEWPGNVRELENAIEHALVLGSTDLIIPDDLPEAVLESAQSLPDSRAGYHQTVRESKKGAILAALEKSHGSFTEAAKLLNVHPNYLHRLVRNLNLKDQVKKAGVH